MGVNALARAVEKKTIHSLIPSPGESARPGCYCEQLQTPIKDDFFLGFPSISA